MDLHQALVDISNDARGWLKAWTGDFTDAEATRTVPGGPNPLAWHLGHLASVEDDVVALFSGAGLKVPPALRALVATGCPGPTAETRYPPLSDLWRMLEDSHARLISLAEKATPADLDREPLTPNRFFRSLGQAIYEAALHENYHVGEIGALRKALGKPKMG
ncbi:MAG: DinB family protein [Gemmatimonadota bacterium]